MKKFISSLAAISLLSLFFVLPEQSYAADCNAAVEDVEDYAIEVTTDMFFRKTIQSPPEDNCPESEVLGSFGTGQILWVLGIIETGVVVDEETDEYGNWLYLKHPTTGEYGFIWSKYTKKVDSPEEGHQEEVIGSTEDKDQGEKECKTISNVTDYFIKTTEGIIVRNGACNGNAISSIGPGEEVKVIGKIDAWLYIEMSNGERGFITSEYTSKIATPEDREGDEEIEIDSDETAVVGEPESDVSVDPTPPQNNSGTLKDILGHPYETAIRYLEAQNIVEGYPDGFFKADIDINRAEFVKIVVGAKLKSEPFSSAANCFPDVAQDAWYASYVCYAKDNGIVSGFPDKTFKPGDNIKFVEAAKILVNTFGLDKRDETDLWYEVYVEVLQKNKYIPTTLNKLDQLVNRGEMSEMIWRILEKVSNKSSAQFDLASGQNTTPQTPDETGDENKTTSELAACMDKSVPDSIDMNKVRSEWLKWHNDVRTQEGVKALTLNDGLNFSGSTWAEENKKDGGITHTRENNQSVNEWFKELGVDFDTTLSGFVYAENIGAQKYTCSDSDCTDEVIVTIKTIFDAFMDEKGTSSTAHYDDIIEPDFKALGLGIAIDSANSKVYLTSHYAQALLNYPKTCQP